MKSEVTVGLQEPMGYLAESDDQYNNQTETWPEEFEVHASLLLRKITYYSCAIVGVGEGYYKIACMTG